MSTPPRSVAVCGSCITRDNFNSRFNADHRRWYEVGAQSNQTSMIAMMSPPVDPHLTAADGLSEYDAWNVGSDLSRSFLAEVVEAQPDYLILDFFGDLHFGVLRLDDGRYVTDNRSKLHRTAQYTRWRDAGGTEVLRHQDDPERYFALWVSAMDRFAAYVAQHCPDTAVIVHRGFYAAQTVTAPTGRPTSLRRHAQLKRLKVGRANGFWARLDEHAVTAYGWASIDLRAEHYTSATDHPWGAFWVHYSLDYYPRFLAELHRIDLERRLSADLAEAVGMIAEAGRGRLAIQSDFTRAAVRAQAVEIARLEHRGVLRSAREAIARRRQAAR